jgi:hypothetical protein
LQLREDPGELPQNRDGVSPFIGSRCGIPPSATIAVEKPVEEAMPALPIAPPVCVASVAIMVLIMIIPVRAHSALNNDGPLFRAVDRRLWRT